MFKLDEFLLTHHTSSKEVLFEYLIYFKLDERFNPKVNSNNIILMILFFTSLGILLTVCFRVFDFLSKLPFSAPRNFLYGDKFTVGVRIFFIVIVFMHTF